MGGCDAYNRDSGGKQNTVCNQHRAGGNRETCDKKLEENPEFAAYYLRRGELSVEQGCLLWGHRVVIPVKLRGEMLKLLHATHMGMSAMKALARNYVWWPKLDSEIENVARTCETCQMNSRLPAKSIPHPWRSAEEPWQRIHLDFAGPYKGSMWLIVVCSYSKWIEVVDMLNNTTSTKVIKELRKMFTRFGLPKILVSDNGPQLTSHEFQNFCAKNGIQHVTIPCYHPASNGMAESIVGKFKAAMNKMSESNKDMNLSVANWLLQYNNTPHSSTNVEPAIRMFGRRLRSALSLVHPLSTSKSKIRANEDQQVLDADDKLRRFVVGDQVLYRDVVNKRWLKGVIDVVSDKQYEIRTHDGASVTKHIDHIRKFHNPSEEKGVDEHKKSENVPKIDSNIPSTIAHDSSTIAHDSSTNAHDPVNLENAASNLPSSSTSLPLSVDLQTRRSTRTSKPVDRLKYDQLGG